METIYTLFFKGESSKGFSSDDYTIKYNHNRNGFNGILLTRKNISEDDDRSSISLFFVQALFESMKIEEYKELPMPI